MCYRKRLAVFFYFSFTFSFFSQRLNVYDTLLSHHLFSHLEAEKKSEYFLDKGNNLKRRVFLSSEVLHYHKSHEDSIYHFLKQAYGSRFNTLVFVAGETVGWQKDNNEAFSWKRGELINKQKIDQVYAALSEMENQPRRPGFLHEEENNHFFFYHHYLIDSVNRIIYCYNSLIGKFRGKIIYSRTGEITEEHGFYANGKVFYDYYGKVMTIYNQHGKKIFTSDSSTIKKYNENEEVVWDYDKVNRESTNNNITYKTKSYYKEIYFMWRKVMSE